MNKIILLGRLVKDPELRHTENGEKIYTKFTIAVQRNLDYLMELEKRILYL